MEQNKVILCGMAATAPKIFKEEETGEYKLGVLTLNVVRNNRATGDTDRQLRQYTIFVKSDKPEIIEKFDKINQFDQVFVKGVLVTKAKDKVSICPECQTEQIQQGMIVYIYPIYVDILNQNLTRKESADLLYERKEISNDIEIMGHLCNDPIKVEALKKTPIVQYQLGVGRKYRIDEEKTDFPWVKSYGKNAKDDLLRLRTGSGVFIEGFLQTRAVERKCRCSTCGSMYTWNDYAMEIVPYETEYLKDYVTDEELSLMKNSLN